MRQMSKEIVVDKMMVARRQMQAAIRLFFFARDIVAIHTLTAAAHEVLGSLARHHNIDARSVKHSIEDAIQDRPDLLKEFRDWWSKPQNFLKHADRDPASQLKLQPEITQLMLYDCCVMYQRLMGGDFPESRMYSIWIVCQFGEQFASHGSSYPPEILARAKTIDPNDMALWRLAAPLFGVSL